MVRADRERVFEPFFRGGAEGRAAQQRRGARSAIWRAIASAHGGRTWLADAPAGTAVRFSLPAAR